MKNFLILSVFFTIVIKVALHQYLDIKHDRFKGNKPGNFQPIEYFFFYTQSVKKEYEMEKKLCNAFYIGFIIVAITIFIAKKYIP